MAVVYGDYRTCMLGALNKMGRDAKRPVILLMSKITKGYAYGYAEDWYEHERENSMDEWHTVFNMDAGDAIHIISCRYEDLFKAVENACD